MHPAKCEGRRDWEIGRPAKSAAVSYHTNSASDIAVLRVICNYIGGAIHGDRPYVTTSPAR